MPLPKFIKDAAGILIDVAPDVVGTVVGPAGKKALDGIFSLLGVSDKSEEEQLQALRDMTPEEREQVRQHAAKMFELEIQDRINSRGLALKFGLDKHFQLTMMMFAMVLLIVIPLIIAYLLNLEVNEEVETILVQIVGNVMGVFLTVGAWWFGTSRRGEMKGDGSGN